MNLKDLRHLDKDDLLGMVGLETKHSMAGDLATTLGTFGLGLVENTSDDTLTAALNATTQQRSSLGIAGNFNTQKEIGVNGSFNTSGNTGNITRFGSRASAEEQSNGDVKRRTMLRVPQMFWSVMGCDRRIQH